MKIRGGQMDSGSCIFRFADVEVDERNFSVMKAGEVLPLEPKVFRVLQFLVRHPGRVVSKDELLNAVWNDCTVSESSLTRTIATLRRFLGDDIRESRYIATVPTVGYRFVCEVQVSNDGFVRNGVGDAIRGSPVNPASPKEKHVYSARHAVTFLTALCACILLVVAGWFGYQRWQPRSAPSVQRALTRVTFEEGLQIGSTWSPDGRFIAYSSDRGGTSEIWVQQINGGDPVQITTGSGHKWQPDWSPDGRYIAYSSGENDGGIYIVPALSGVGRPRKIAAFGYFPRWSPDSSRILFQSGAEFGWKEFYVVGLDGSPPREVLTDLGQERAPISANWHPDGKRITAWTYNGNSIPTYSGAIPNFSTELVDGGTPIETRLPTEYQKQIEAVDAGPGTAEWRMDSRFAWSPSGNAIFFERTFRGAKNVWRIAVNPITLEPTSVERLTTSPGLDADFSISRDGSKLAFTGERQQIRAWTFPFNADRGQLLEGSGYPVTSPGIEAWALNLSRDGKRLAIWGDRDGQVGTWERSIPTGREEVLVTGDSYLRDLPIWSPDGKHAAYNRQPVFTCKGQIVLWSSEDRRESPLADGNANLGIVYDWAPDGKSLLVVDCEDRPGIWQLFVEPSLSQNSAVRKLVANPNYELYQPHFSPDGEWIAFVAVNPSSKNRDNTINAVRKTGGPWIRITDGKQWDDKPRWSPDGRTIYFVSERKGFFNVWGIHFDPKLGRPQGEPFQITSYETESLMIPQNKFTVEPSLTVGRLVVPLVQTSGNIWILDNVDR